MFTKQKLSLDVLLWGREDGYKPDIFWYVIGGAKVFGKGWQKFLDSDEKIADTSNFFQRPLKWAEKSIFSTF